MKRHPAFQDLSRDHFTALLRAQHVRRAVAADARAPPFEQAAERFVALWRDGLDLHFLEEDTDLLPLLDEAHAAGSSRAGELAARLRHDHGALREVFAGLEAQKPGQREKDTFAAAAEALQRHARWEEEVLFGWFQDRFSEAELQALWKRSKAFRIERRGPASVGAPRA